jgi:hypothetical protein
MDAAPIVLDASTRHAEASTVAGPWWTTTNEAGCEVARLPSHDDRPSNDADGDSVPPIYFAMSALRLGAADEGPGKWDGIGFDIDNACTNSSSCAAVNERACKNDAVTPYDGLECRDNELGQLSKLSAASPLGQLFGFSEEDWNCELHRGGFSVVFKISGYDGEPNDPMIRFDMYTSTGIRELPGWNCHDTIEKPLNPGWSGYADWLRATHWQIASASLDPSASNSSVDVPDARAADPIAFVRGGYFFAQIPDGTEFWLDGARTPVPGFRYLMHRGVIVGRLTRQADDSWVIEDGTVSFAVLPDEYVNGFRELGFCENMCNAFTTVRDYTKSYVDLIVPAPGGPLPDVPCNALSIAIGFDARQATATAQDVVTVSAPQECPDPRNKTLPRQGCVCQMDGTTCLTPDGGGEP